MDSDDIILGSSSDFSRLFSLIFSNITSVCFEDSLSFPGEITSIIGFWLPDLSLFVFPLKLQFCNEINRLPNLSLTCKDIFEYSGWLPKILV